jgi:hypothetical protein
VLGLVERLAAAGGLGLGFVQGLLPAGGFVLGGLNLLRQLIGQG